MPSTRALLATMFPQFFRQASIGDSMLPARPSSMKGKTVTADGAMRQSAVWGALVLRANLISTLPIDVYRYVEGIQVELPKPPILINPGGARVGMREWLFSTQMDLDRVGNCYGIIREIDGAGRPRRIDLVSHADVVVRVRDDVITYKIKGTVYSEDEIWHERQYTIPGLVVGLSPIAYAAWSLGLWQSAVEFGMEWFGNNGQIPYGHLKNTAKILGDGEADRAKKRYKAAVEGGDLFVTGKDWDFSSVNAPAADAKFLDAQGYSDLDAVRFFGVPGDLVDVATKGSSITYANITQRNLQFLIMNLGPAIVRREDALSRLLSAPRFVKFNTEALLRMDPETATKLLLAETGNRPITAPSEARALRNRAPFTPEQLAELELLKPSGSSGSQNGAAQ